MNELAMVLSVDEDDTRCPFVAGMEDIAVDEVLRPRECVLTNKSYKLLKPVDTSTCFFPAGLTEREVRAQIFHGGRLVCRMVNIVFTRKTTKPYSGIVRQLYAEESDSSGSAVQRDEPGMSRNTSILLDDDEDDSASVASHSLSGLGKKRTRSNLMDTTQGAPQKRRSAMPIGRSQYTFADVFCGAGGASQGAKQAGFMVQWGLDDDKDAIEAYALNHPGAIPFRCNAHNFPPRGYTDSLLRVDVLHLSPPCCYFSPAQ
jgi:DNA (cytosine-5)-methyltransferase 1